tara:strand:- start:157 stop:501 length:345 start_codon:yes stop_codon:yes gene_type:complete
MKLYVDADETLVKWEMSLEINKELVELLHQGLRKGTYDITVWSIFGKDWAEKYTQMLFPEFNLPYGIKHDLYLSVPEGSYAIDNRKEVDKGYLINFKKIFTSDEFISFQKIGPI